MNLCTFDNAFFPSGFSNFIQSRNARSKIEREDINKGNRSERKREKEIVKEKSHSQPVSYLNFYSDKKQIA